MIRKSISRLNLALVAVAILIAVAGVVIGDQIIWSSGYGYDGRVYGHLAEDFPGSVFGDRGVVPPGVLPFEGQPPIGLDSYYVGRMAPSALVYFTLDVLGIPKEPGAIIATFQVYTVLMFALVAFFWTAISDLLKLSKYMKILGFIALIVNFAVIKTGSYWPVLTDQFALAIGVISLYLWLSNKRMLLALSTILGAFTWPSILVVGAAMLAFPAKKARSLYREEATQDHTSSATVSPDSRLPRTSYYVASVFAIAVLALLLLLKFQVIQNLWDNTPEARASPVVFPLSVAVSVTFVFMSTLWLSPKISVASLKALVKRTNYIWFIQSVALIAVVLIAQSLIAKRPNDIYLNLLKSGIWYSTNYPGVFLIAAVSYFGPLLLITIRYWPRVCERIREFGPAMLVIVFVAIFTGLLTESRKIINVYPALVLITVLVVQQVNWRRIAFPIFVVASIVFSRVWLPIGKFGYNDDPITLLEFPAQKYYMSAGLWIAPEMYLLQLAVFIIGLVAVIYLKLPKPNLNVRARFHKLW